MLGNPVQLKDLPLFSGDLDFLRAVFERSCEERRIFAKTPEANGVGALLITLYRHGVEDEEKLLTLAKAYRHQTC